MPPAAAAACRLSAACAPLWQVFYAFVVDSGLYAIWQATLMGDAPARYRYLPFFGLAAWLVAAPKQQQPEPERRA
jgi:hypothetical protein